MEYFSYFEFRYILNRGFAIVFYNKDDLNNELAYFGKGKFEKIDDSTGSKVINRFYNSRTFKFYKMNKPVHDDCSLADIEVKDIVDDELVIDVSYGKKVDTLLLRNYDSKCTCKTHVCRHYYAVEQWAIENIKLLMESYIFFEKDVDKSHFLSPELLDYLSEYEKKISIENINKAKEIVKEKISSIQSEEYIYTLILFFLKMSDYYYYDSLYISKYLSFFYALFNDPFCYNTIVESNILKEYDCYGKQEKSNKSLIIKTLKNFDKAKKEVEKKGLLSYDLDNPNRYLYLLVNNNIPLLIKYFASSSDIYDEECLNFLNELLIEKDQFINDVESIKKIIKNLDKDTKTTLAKDILSKYLSILAINDKVDAIATLNKNYIDISHIKDFTIEQQKKLIYSIYPNKSSIDTILNTILKDEDPKIIASYILKTTNWIDDNRDNGGIDILFESAYKLPYSRLIFAYLAKFLGIDKTTYNIPKKSDEEREILDYFNTSWEFDDKANCVKCDFYIDVPFEANRYMIDVTDEGGKLSLYNPFSEVGYSIEPKKLIDICLKNSKDEYLKAKSNEEDRVARLKFSKTNKKFTTDMVELQLALSKDNSIILSDDSLAHIEYSFFYEDNIPSLSFRIGINKLYMVKDALEFIAAFKNGSTINYGKDLIFTHDFDNITYEDRDIMRLLTPARLNYGKAGDSKNKKFIKLSNSLFSSLLVNLKGRVVIFNNQNVKVRLDKHMLYAGIDKKYQLYTSIKDEETSIFLGSKGFIFLKENGEYYIDIIDNTSEELKLLEFFENHSGVGVKPILNEFKNKIYARFGNFITLDNEIKDSFKLSSVRLSAHFDYENGIITCLIKYLKDDVEIERNKLTQLDINRAVILENYLSTLGFSEDGQLVDDSKILSFFRMDFSKLRSLATVYLSESLMNKKIVSVSRQVFKITYNSGIMELFLEKSEFTEKELAEILSALKKKKKYILLKDNRIIDLDNEEAKEFGETVNDFQMDSSNLYQKLPVPMATAIKALAHQRNCHVDKYLKNMIEDIRSFKSADIKLPTLNAKLRGYQIEGYNWLSILASYGLGGILADDMGLGKTLQMIALLKADKTLMPSLIVCPKSLVFNWKSEFLKFDGKTEVVEVYGPESSRSKIIGTIKPNKKVIYITSIDSLRSDIKKYECQFNYVIIDEAQYIRNVYAQKTKSVKSLEAKHRFALTGTPIENSIIDLWSIFDFIMPGYLEDINVFKQSDHEAIRRKVAPFILRRTKSDVLTDLPSKYERILSCEMSNEQRVVYEAERSNASKILEETGKAFDILPYLTRLRQICIAPSLYLDKYKGESAKFELLKSLIPDYLENGHRILVFSQFVTALEALGNILHSLNINYFLLTGDTPAKKRIEMMNDFNEVEGPDVFLISLKAGGTGLNLTGADTVIHIDPWWNIAAEDQADDRTHRIGQKRNVEVIKLIVEDSIEQRVLELQEIKKDIIDKVISKDDSSVSNAKLEDIAFILKK